MVPLPSYEDQLAALERAVGALIFAKFLAALARLQLGLSRLLARLSAFPLTTPEFARQITDFLDTEVPRVLAALPDNAQALARHAVERAYEIGGGEPGGYTAGVDIASIITGHRIRAEHLIHPSVLTTPHAARAVVAVVKRIETRSKTALAWEMTRAAATAQLDRARARGWRLIWVGERDACVVCAALIGDHVVPGEQFSHTATWDSRKAPPVFEGDLRLPPRHPNCRCEVQAIAPEDAPRISDVLRREARRSIARGWRTPSEAERARLRAAAKLLRRGARLPATVEEAARRSLRRGRFPRSITR